MAVKTFEGEEIDGNVIVLKQYTGAIPVPLMRGEKVRLVVEAEVKSISFDENMRTGKTYRVHRLHTNEVMLEMAGLTSSPSGDAEQQTLEERDDDDESSVDG